MRDWKRHSPSISVKIISMVLGTLLLANLVTAHLIRDMVYKDIVSQQLTTVDILTSSLVHDVKYEYELNSHEGVQAVIAKFATYYRIIRSISFYDQDGIARADSDPARIGLRAQTSDVQEALAMAKPAAGVTRPDWENFGIRSVAPILQGSRIVGAVAIDVSIQDIEATLRAIDRRLWTIMVVKVVLVCAVLLFLLRRSILLRIGRLMSVTHQIAAGDYAVRVDDNGKDELAQLALAFNSMTDDLRRSKQEIEDYNKRLEERVQESTAQLQHAYEDLKSAQSQLVLNEKMASLGVLIAGVAHEINTPVGAILNVSRSLEKRVCALPNALETLHQHPHISPATMVACLRDVIRVASQPCRPASYQQTREVEQALRGSGIANYQSLAASLAKLNIVDLEMIARHIDCFRDESFFALAESYGCIAQAAKISEASSQKIAEIVRALKYYAYSGKDRVELIQINESIQTALVLLRNVLKHSVTVSTDFDPDLPRIACTSEIHQVWTNLLTNACDAIEELGDGHAGRIDVTTRFEGDQVKVTVADNGGGIPESKIDKVFDPFFTTKDIGKGTGLGLCIVSGILKKVSGTVRAESGDGRTVFEIMLPVTASLPENDESGDDRPQFTKDTDSASEPNMEVERFVR